jgi:hypothetical protein
MPDPAKIITHSDPVWREQTNFIIRLDLSPHGAPGQYEQIWTRTDDQQLFQICCIPFFTYGISLGDTLQIDPGTGAHTIRRKSGHRTIRLAFLSDTAAHEQHDQLHDTITGKLGCLAEFHGPHYAAIDLAEDHQAPALINALTPLKNTGELTWEWADPQPAD